MPTLTPSPMQQEALAYARNHDTLVNWIRGSGKTTFLALFAQQCLRQYDDCVLIHVAPTQRQVLQLNDVIGAVCTIGRYVPQVFLITRPEDTDRLGGLHKKNLIVLMDECQDISRFTRSNLQEVLRAVMPDTPVRIAQTATIPQFGPAVL